MKALKPRHGIEELLSLARKAAVKVVEEGEDLVLHVALPTGYGKSEASILIHEEIVSGSLSEYAERVVHVVPTRCLVEDLVERARSKGIESYGQCMFLDPSLKSPYLLPTLVFVTADSYAMNFYKAPVAEIKAVELGSSGHYDIPIYAVATAVNVFDEYHLLAPGDDPVEDATRYANRSWTVLTYTVQQLLKQYRSPVILETATPLPQQLHDALSYRGVESITLSYDASISGSVERSGNEVKVRDREFEDAVLQYEYVTKVKEGSFNEAVVEEIQSCEKPVLIACNTVKKAVEVYGDLKSKLEDLGLDEVVLLHSQFTIGDREYRVARIKSLVRRGRSVAVIATQVIEVGVDLDFNSIITEAAPLVPLVQRVGRVGRHLKEERREFKITVVYDESRARGKAYSGVYDLELTRRTVKALKQVVDSGGEKSISWRIPSSNAITCDNLKLIPYNKLAEQVYSGVKFSIDGALVRILNYLASPWINSREALKAVRELGSLIRDDLILPVLVTDGIEEGPAEDKLKLTSIVPCRADKLGFNFKKGSLEINKEQASRVLQMRGDEILAIIARGEAIEARYLSFKDVEKLLVRGAAWFENEAWFLEALVAKPEAYSREEGLRTW